MSKINAFELLFAGYERRSKETVLPGGNRRITFPGNWHELNGRLAGGRTSPPRFNLHGLPVAILPIEESVRVFKLFSGK
jgi:hypothetical protein